MRCDTDTARGDAMKGMTNSGRGEVPPNVVRLSAPVSAAKQPARVAPQRPLIQPHSGHPVGGPALGGAERQGPGTDGKARRRHLWGDKGGVPIRQAGQALGTGGVERRNRCEAGVMDAQPAIPMIRELPPDCIIRCLKWLVPLPRPCFLGRRATTTRPQFDMAINRPRPRLPSTNTARPGRDLGRGRGYTQSTWNF